MSRPAEARTTPILVTMGEPGGIGPEVAVAACKTLAWRAGRYALKLVGDPDVFRRHGAPDQVTLETKRCAKQGSGSADALNAESVIDAVDTAVRETMDGRAAAIVTAPIHKASLMEAGFAFAGHTDYLQHLTNARRAVMMLVGGDLRVIPLTVHIPLAEVPAQITTSEIIDAAGIVLSSLTRDFAIPRPRLAVAGLNPHAGEDGRLGKEEREIIGPAIAELRTAGWNVSGPFSADTMFHASARARYDAALCMYHDQALIPLKTLAFWEGVNVTLGLPIVRTSPDHGTALDIAGKGMADPRSMIAAINLAAFMADARSR